MSRTVPSIINAGFSFNAQAWLRNYCSAEWTIDLLFVGAANISLTAERVGARYVFSATAADTATWVAGEYTYFLRAVSGDDVFLLEQGTVRVVPDATKIAPGTDIRSDAQKALDNIDAVLMNKASQDQKRYRINNRELERFDPQDLIALRAHFFELVQREKAKTAGKSMFGRQVKFHMGPR